MGTGVASGSGHTGFSAGGQRSGSGARTISRGGGGDAQPASASRIATRPAVAVDDNGRTGFAIRRRAVAWVFLEIVAALAIAVGIVWWTLPKKPKDAVPTPKNPPEDGQD